MDGSTDLLLPKHPAYRHTYDVYSVIAGGLAPPNIEEVSTSWRRSACQYGINPDKSEAPNILTLKEVESHRQALDDLIFCAQEEIDHLYKVVRDAGYTVLLCNRTGVAVEHRGDATAADQFKNWGAWLGGVFAEELEGTNGIGTCIAEERSVTIHRSQHFRSRNTDLSCSGAPIFDIDGTLMAVLDVSSVDPGLSESAHGLAGPLTIKSARAIEERYFRTRFRKEWIVMIVPPEDDSNAMLLAVDAGERIIAANRSARDTFHLQNDAFPSGLSLWTIFVKDADLFRPTKAEDLPKTLTRQGDFSQWLVLATPPQKASSLLYGQKDVALHTRPRLGLLGALKNLPPKTTVYGGLSPRTMRRVCEYIEQHFSERIQIAELAGIASLSIYHFARQFRVSAGVTPHIYITRKRLEVARTMLTQTDLSVTEVALAAGFSDQSHFTRLFRHFVGTTPARFRWSQR
ncbi:helix-turn-helix domain-containing protein [Dongia soli]|uniref:Helix-turn-helix domain-containing protein n=1 Tax=Dongia soli TaxID=600628 RepID=A0ABU5EJ17_9PROT|nr:helix-turn-helix domain-containing protein [Dongia soli]MDY0885919.1 helix-turn-helix domain-containing protein [Dongia soli]